ncbi:MAG: hypothetical protein ACREXU_07410 [Gammaproteobacteria bacterium]
MGDGACAATVCARFGHQRLKAALAVALEPVAQGLRGDAGAGGPGDDVVGGGLFFDPGIKALGARRQLDEIGNQAVAKQREGLAVLWFGIVGHG